MSASAGPICRVVFHADDFGMNAAVNAGILKSFRHGVLTSTSLLSNAPAATEACHEWPGLLQDLAVRRLESLSVRQELGDPDVPFDLGVHLNLTQGRPLTGDRYPAELLNERGEFPGIGAVFTRFRRTTPTQVAKVADELNAQIEWMCDHHLRPSHLNGHQYVELLPPIAAMIPEMMERYQIPVCRVARESALVRTVLTQGRLFEWGIGLVKRYFASRFLRRMRRSRVRFPDQFFGTAHAGRIDRATMTAFLRRARGVETTEVGIHPGDPPDAAARGPSDPWFDPLQELRAFERDLLCSPAIRDVMAQQGMKLGRLQLLTPTSLS
ncbi:carbohydrate deacetylase [Schlesneria paludicola]|uniref:carbohydrate deacetylase n=1 Tax=Schlesneria paludicola TaxID=360056 RepID=UPI00029B2F1E|nr:ChbG/HpnK family deacetylase [Schlesneria paludicola]